MEKLTGQEIVQIAFLKALEMNKPHRSKRLCKLSKIIKYFHIQKNKQQSDPNKYLSFFR
jgi:hypothetical protein